MIKCTTVGVEPSDMCYEICVMARRCGALKAYEKEQTMSEQPKACPFCGWETIVDEAFFLPNKHICKCNACGARTRICRTWEDAVKLWNMRKGAEEEG